MDESLCVDGATANCARAFLVVPDDLHAPLSQHRSERAVIAFLAFIGVCLAYGVDASLPAFDDIRSTFHLGAASTSVSLVTTTYLLGMAAGQLVGGVASDRFGRRNVLLAGLVVYAAGALAAATAPSFGLLLVARTVWGMGAAVPSVLRSAITRDLYSGDAMARVATIAMAVFLMGPIVAPSVGAALLSVGSWRIVFLVAVPLAVTAAVWTLAFGETLPVERRRSTSAGEILAAAREVLRHRSTRSYTLAQTFTSGAFFSFLGSSQPIIERIYDRGDRFPLYFGAAGAVMAVALLANNRVIRIVGSGPLLDALAAAAVAVSAVGVVMVLFTGGVPPFGVFFVWMALANALLTLQTPLLNAKALEPMGAVAGTASTILGLAMFAGGAALARVIDASIGATVTAMPVGYLCYTTLALWALRIARSAERRTADAAILDR